MSGCKAFGPAGMRREPGRCVLGYHFFGGLPWIDALVNASMILGGMGPVDPIATQAGKLFASAYALFSGLLFIGAASLVMAPFVHRIMHTIHLDTDDRAEPPRRDGAPRSGT